MKTLTQEKVEILCDEWLEIGFTFETVIRLVGVVFIRRAITRYKNQCRAAVEIGIHRNTMHRWLHK